MEGLGELIRAIEAHGKVHAFTGPDASKGMPYVLVPDGANVHDLEHLLPAPIRARGCATAHDVAGIIAYVKRFRDREQATNGDTLIFADAQQFKIVALIDYSRHGAPKHHDHRITYTCPKAVEWETWARCNKMKMDQPTFAEFIEANVLDIRKPDGAKILEVARNLQSHKSVKFASAIRLDNGEQQFEYSEEIQGSVRGNRMSVPEKFELGIPVFFMGDHYKVEVLLRYRIAEGRLSFWYEIVRPHIIERDAFKTTYEQVEKGLNTKVVLGAP